MTREERYLKLSTLDLNNAKAIIVACHEIMDKAGVPEDASRFACDDPECISHLTHRLHEYVNGCGPVGTPFPKSTPPEGK